MSGPGLPQGPPGALSPDASGPTDPLSVSGINDLYMQQKQGLESRLETDGRGFDSVFSQ